MVAAALVALSASSGAQTPPPCVLDTLTAGFPPQWLGTHVGQITIHARNVAEGGGTDAAFAALKTKAPVIERFGLRGFGAHSNDAEYVDIDSIEPRLYLAARTIMDVAQGKH